jgi:hypothetical protein
VLRRADAAMYRAKKHPEMLMAYADNHPSRI